MNAYSISGIAALLLALALAFMPVGTDVMTDETEASYSETVFDETGYIMLADFYKATVATVGGDGYDETVLYLNPDGDYEVHFFSNYEYYEKEEHRAYSVDGAVLDEIYRYAEENRLKAWNDECDSFGLSGAYYVFKYVDTDGTVIRVTSDRMPDNGLSVMYGANTIMRSFISEENRLY